MKKNNRFWVNSLAIMGVILILTSSCKKNNNEGQVPILTTSDVSNITQTTAFSGGVITSEGKTTITVRGVCWSKNTTPSINIDDKTSDGAGAGSFASVMSGLNPNTTYFVRAYATNSAGTGYGSAMSFITPTLQIPVLTTTAVSNLAPTTATCGGNISLDGGTGVSVRGVCWSTSQTPTITNNKTTDGTGIGSFVSSISGLTPGATYYFRAYATNGTGTAYGNQVNATTTTVLPTITTTTVSALTSTTLTSGGSISSDGGAEIISRGICWSTSQNPTNASNKTTDGSGTSSFISSISGLTPGTTYYIRAYATNGIGTAYGNQITITTNAILPSITTSPVSTITATSAKNGGNITYDGGAAITARGVCWSTSQNPTTANSKTIDGIGTGIFTSSITGLTLGNIYYVRAYAINSIGTVYGDQLSFMAVTIGDTYQGGKVAYIFQIGDPGYITGQTHGLIVAASDQSTGIPWYNNNNGTQYTNAKGIEIGTGNANTNTIVSIQGIGTYAAKLCYDLVLNGYTDWYLPSKNELNLIYLNKSAFGSFSYYYWSSSEVYSGYAWAQTFLDGSQTSLSTSSSAVSVRAIRSF